MNTRDLINKLTDDFKRSLVGVCDGKATPEQQAETLQILDSIGFYTIRLMVFGDKKTEGAAE